MGDYQAARQVNDLINKLAVLKDIHPLVRVVDPVYKSVFIVKNGEMIKEECNCYEFWNRGRVCDNCISMRAYQFNDSMVKIDYSSDKIYMVTAVPVPLGERQVVVETIKDVTNSMFVEGDGFDDRTEFRALIAKLNEALYKDTITGMYNKRFIGERIPVNIADCCANRRPISLIMCDIDYFKNLNDSYGHGMGDHVLTALVPMLLAQLNSEKSWIARYGGDELIICLPDTDGQLAIEIAEQMRQDVQHSQFRYDEKCAAVTMSFGVYTLSPARDIEYKRLIDIADGLLYKAKRLGRNRVVAATDNDGTSS